MTDLASILIKYIKDNGNTIVLSTFGEVSNLEKIGQGGNGVVYGGEWFGKTLAFKFLINPNGSKKKYKRFIADYFNLQKLENKKGIVVYYNLDYLMIDTNRYEVIIMEKYEGSLIKKNKDENKFKEFKALFRFLLNTVENIHSKGIIHRDLKPQNILFEGENYYITDFGIAGFNPEQFKIKASSKNDNRLGNRLFSAPEQDREAEATKEMDIYAIGQIMHRFVFGKPKKGEGKIELNKAIPEIPVYINNIIYRCLQSEPKLRYRNIKELRSALNDYKKKPIYYVLLFNKILRSTYPKIDSYYITHSKDKKRIDNLFSELENNAPLFGSQLRYTYGVGNMYFHPYQINGRWKFAGAEYEFNKNGMKGYVFDIAELRIYRSYSPYGDFILVHYNQDQPEIIDGNECYSYCLVDNKHFVSFQEGDDGYADIEGEPIDLSLHQYEFIEKQREEGYIFIGSGYNSIIHRENEKHIAEFIKDIKSTGLITPEMINKFGNQISLKKDMRLII